MLPALLTAKRRPSAKLFGRGQKLALQLPVLKQLRLSLPVKLSRQAK
jgi:hypothetical protein